MEKHSSPANSSRLSPTGWSPRAHSSHGPFSVGRHTLVQMDDNIELIPGQGEPVESVQNLIVEAQEQERLRSQKLDEEMGLGQPGRGSSLGRHLSSQHPRLTEDDDVGRQYGEEQLDEELGGMGGHADMAGDMGAEAGEGDKVGPLDGLTPDGAGDGAGMQPTKVQLKNLRSRRKDAKKQQATVIKTWLRIDTSGETRVLHADKWKLTQKLGVQTRDLRLLDPQMATTYPSAILCRDKCLVVNLEHIKVIITTVSVFVVNHEDEATQKFVEELKTRLAHPGMGASKSFASTGDLQRAAAANGGGGGGLGGVGGIPLQGLSAQLPFELRALEVCLDELASEYDALTTELEATAYPALDSLANKVTSSHLERVRRIKNRLVRLTTRVETVREVLEKFLDDDKDMHDLNLTANAEREREREAMDLDRPLMHPSMTGPGLGGMGGEGGGGASAQALGRLSIKSQVSSLSTNSSIVENEIAEVEMLLEAYFMHFDNTFNRLQTLNEYIKDTEDLVNIKLDQHRNQLISTDLVLTALTCAMAIITTIAGIFGMNLDSGLQTKEGVFNQVTIISSVGCLGLFFAFVIWAWRANLLVFA